MNRGSQKCETLRQFTRWWWENGCPVDYFEAASEPRTKTCEGSVEFVIFRSGQFQVEKIILLPRYPVPDHCHPNVETYECHIVGGGVAELQHVDGEHVHWHQVPLKPDYTRHVKYRRLRIKPGQYHRGVAHVTNVALSFQHWLNDVPPTFITNDWEGAPWR